MLQNNLLKIYVEPGAYAPVRAYPTDAGLDIHTPIGFELRPGEQRKVNTGVHVSIDDGYVGFIKSRSSMLGKDIATDGTIDASYRGAITVVLKNHDNEAHYFRPGDRIAQLVILPVELPNIKLVDSLEALGNTDRGSGGFGSTGR